MTAAAAAGPGEVDSAGVDVSDCRVKISGNLVCRLETLVGVCMGTSCPSEDCPHYQIEAK